MALANPPHDDDTLRTELRGAGLRATPARVAVLGVLRDGGSPMTHGEVADRLDGRGWDRATIFRNLVALVEAGFVRRTDVGDHVWRFETLADRGPGPSRGHEHAHFLCTGCGEVTCMPELELKLPRRGQVPQSVRSRSVEVQLRGLCDDCG
jgi:Fur family transcriptional regulator, ferric uptake regulator